MSEQVTPLTAEEAMQRASSYNPRSRRHDERTADGRHSWSCVPIADVSGLRDEAIATLDATRAAEGELRTALERLLSEPTMNILTGAAEALYDKAKRSATQEVTITAQALRMLLPAIETEAVSLVIRAALRASTSPEESQ